MKNVKFDLGSITITSGVKDLIDEHFYRPNLLISMLNCFMSGDFGQLDKDDIELNHAAINENYGRVMGIFNFDGITVWCMTHLGDNNYTTVLLPDEY